MPSRQNLRKITLRRRLFKVPEGEPLYCTTGKEENDGSTASRAILTIQRDGKNLTLHENDSANPELFVDGIHGWAAMGSVVKVSFFRSLVSFEEDGAAPADRRDLSCRLVMGIDIFLSVADFLASAAKDIRAKRDEALKQEAAE